MGKTLDDLKKMTILVADTSDIASFKKYPVRDGTTNPSLVLQAAKDPQYRSLIEKTVAPFKGKKDFLKEDLLDAVLVAFGQEILKIIPGRISTEVDAYISFDRDASIERARKLIDLYAEQGINKDRVLIKLASTWEGFQAAKVLEKEGIHCNMTLLFSVAQAIAAANAGATLISPFVGRILDWYKKHKNFNGPASEDPGVLSVRKIYDLLKNAGSKIEVMGASFRSKEEILELAGCDFLTISPQFYDELGQMDQPLTRKLTPPTTTPIPLPELEESEFRFLLNEDEMATDKLAEGIRKFAADTTALETLLLKDFL